MSTNSKEAILAAARQIAQAHGYGGLNYRDLAAAVGIKAASIYHHFPSKADLAAAVARRYREDTAVELEAMAAQAPNAAAALRRYPQAFRRALENDNRLCLCSFMSAEVDDLPDIVRAEVRAFADVNVAWLAKGLAAAGIVAPDKAEGRARAIFAAISGAQLMARSRADITLYDSLVDSYRAAGLLPS
ncbi:TetR/AcrR family transcriptional regulator [Nitrospirillum viridazoti]|uniref:TetR family transcriptional regulator n=1 Tax=Nitrospirillum amazonense TaxID=28077 RepID=A0A560IYH6_9PROT|nr:TetR/AcrR family transcriptional regulator [Nitrospirillum amazonense]TWB63966.1 TetR family transcriptional regulator [Nitrospirillum amazonense]